MRSLTILRRYDVVLCDIDGVLHQGFDVVPGVPELWREIERDGPLLFAFTNNGSFLPDAIAARLGEIGLPLAPDRVVAAGEVLVDAFLAHGLRGKPILNIGNEPAAEYIRRAGGVPLPAVEARRCFREAAAIVVGSTVQLDKAVVEAACNALRHARMPVLCTNPDVFAPGRNGELILVAGAMANLLEREMQVPVERLGKPFRPIFDLALRRVAAQATGSPRVLVVDDNLESGIRGGRDLGLDTLLVLGGTHRTRREAETVMDATGIRPTWMAESLGA